MVDDTIKAAVATLENKITDLEKKITEITKAKSILEGLLEPQTDTSKIPTDLSSFTHGQAIIKTLEGVSRKGLTAKEIINELHARGKELNRISIASILSRLKKNKKISHSKTNMRWKKKESVPSGG